MKIQTIIKAAETKDLENETEIKKLTKDSHFFKIYVKKQTDSMTETSEKIQQKYDKLQEENKQLQTELKTQKKGLAKI